MNNYWYTPSWLLYGLYSRKFTKYFQKDGEIEPQEGDRAERGSLQVYILTQKRGFVLAWNRTDMGARMIIE